MSRARARVVAILGGVPRRALRLDLLVVTALVFAAVAIHRRELESAQAERAQLIATLASEAISNHMIEIGSRGLVNLIDDLRSHGLPVLSQGADAGDVRL
ncbi:MAG: hypothetical protein AABZ26_03985, partial [Chloroflexota bacterium]